MKNNLAVLPLLFSLLVPLTVGPGTAMGQEEPDPAELAKQYDRLKSFRFYRHSSYVYDHLLRFTQMEPERITPYDEFVRAFYEGRWNDIRKTLEGMRQEEEGHQRLLERALARL